MFAVRERTESGLIAGMPAVLSANCYLGAVGESHTVSPALKGQSDCNFCSNLGGTTEFFFKASSLD